MCLISKLFLIFIMLIQFACASSPLNEDETASGGPERRGTSVEVVELKYYDGLPSLTADGTKVAFISGRNGIRQAFWRDLSGQDSKPVRLLNDAKEGLEELEVILSSDGSFALVLGYLDTEFVLYLQSLDAQSAPVEIVKGPERKNFIGISPDGSYLTYQLKNNETQKDEIWLGAVAGDLSGVTTSQLATDGKTRRPAFAASNSGQQTLLAYQLAEGIGQTNLLRYEFGAGDDLSSEQASRLYTSVLADDDLLVAGETRAYLLRDVFVDESILTRPSSGNRDEPTKVNVINGMESVTLADGSGELVDSKGFRVRDVAGNKSGNVVAMVVNERVECKALDSDSIQTRFTSSLYLFNAADNSQSLVLPVADQELKTWGLERADLCLNQSSGSEAKVLDDRIVRSTLNADATASNYVIAYETQVSKNNGEYNDREIRVLTVNGSEVTFTEVSENAKPLE